MTHPNKLYFLSSERSVTAVRCFSRLANLAGECRELAQAPHFSTTQHNVSRAHATQPAPIARALQRVCVVTDACIVAGAWCRGVLQGNCQIALFRKPEALFHHSCRCHGARQDGRCPGICRQPAAHQDNAKRRQWLGTGSGQHVRGAEHALHRCCALRYAAYALQCGMAQAFTCAAVCSSTQQPCVSEFTWMKSCLLCFAHEQCMCCRTRMPPGHTAAVHQCCKSCKQYSNDIGPNTSALPSACRC